MKRLLLILVLLAGCLAVREPHNPNLPTERDMVAALNNLGASSAEIDAIIAALRSDIAALDSAVKGR